MISIGRGARGRYDGLLQAETATRASGKADEPSLQLLPIRTEPSVRLEFVGLLKNICVTVHKMTAHFHNGLSSRISIGETDIFHRAGETIHVLVYICRRCLPRPEAHVSVAAKRHRDSFGGIL